MTKRERELKRRRFDPGTCTRCGSPARFKRCCDGMWRWLCTFEARCC